MASKGASAAAAAAAATATATAGHRLVLDPFCLRQWDPSYVGTSLVGVSAEKMEAAVNEAYERAGGEAGLVAGYAPFCKHVFLANEGRFPTIKSAVVAITDANAGLIRSAYEARTEKELKVLVRYLPKELLPGGMDGLPAAKYLDIILYSREQINKEAAAMGNTPPSTNAPWGIISIKGQDEPFELPMTPITMMRNALGKEQGGSGVPLERDAYEKAVKYWESRVVVR